MGKICVYTCITGGYDNLNEIKKPEKGVDYVCFTNNKQLRSRTWKIVQLDDAGINNRRLARKIKVLGHPAINDKYEVFVWTDADVVWEKPIVEFTKFLKKRDFAIFVHHARKTTFEEAVACLKNRKDTIQNIRKVLDFYAKVGYPDDNGLFESTVFVKRNTAEVMKMLKEWYGIIEKYTERDQLSFSYAIWKVGLEVSPIPLNVWNNEWFGTVKHASVGKNLDCHIYYGDLEKGQLDFDLYHVKPYKQHGSCKIVDVAPVDTDRIEINPTSLAGMLMTSLEARPKPESVELRGGLKYKDKIVVCSSYNSVILLGKFKRGEKITISFEMDQMTNEEVVEFCENAWLQNTDLVNGNAALRRQNESLRATLDSIYNSKGWKILSKMRGLVRPRK